MSESQTQSYTPAPTAPRRISVWVWFVLLLVAIGALVAAVAWAGGLDQVTRVLGFSNFSFSAPNFGGSKPGAPAPAVAARPATSSPLPIDAQSRMYAEQLEDQLAIGDLVNGQITKLTLGTPQTSESSATVPLKATMKDGTSLSAVMTLKKYNGTWYFFSLAADPNHPSADAVSPEAFDSGVVSTISSQQGEAGTQELITNGLLGGGYNVVTVDDVKMGPRTATVDVTLSGGTEDPSKGRFVCISKTDNGTTYWFVARFEKR